VLVRDWFHEPEAVIQRVERILKGGSEEVSAQESAEIDAAEEAIGKESLPEKPAEPKNIAPQPEANPVHTPSGLTDKPGSSAQRVRKFEFIRGASKKFWEIAVTGKAVTVRFGRIGTAGQEQKKLHADEERAQREAEKLIAEKVRKGYVERA
jgi:predicted DNA-binding WGR domain protein